MMDETKIENILKSISRTEVPSFDVNRVRSQILERLLIAQKVAVQSTWFSLFLPYLRVGAGITATFLVVISLTLGTAVAALQSNPGSTIYPLKKVVEKIQLKLASADQKAVLQIQFANNRAEELEVVLEQKQEGKISEAEANIMITSTVNDLKKTAAAAVTTKQSAAKSNTIVNKLADINNKLKVASVQSEGQVKIELEKALEETKLTQEQAIKNLEQAGLKLETPPIIDNSITATGKLTALSSDSLTIGTAKFLLTKDTKFTNVLFKDLKTGLVVDIVGEIKDDKSYAVQIKLIVEKPTEPEETESTEEPQGE